HAAVVLVGRERDHRRAALQRLADGAERQGVHVVLGGQLRQLRRLLESVERRGRRARGGRAGRRGRRGHDRRRGDLVADLLDLGGRRGGLGRLVLLLLLPGRGV